MEKTDLDDVRHFAIRSSQTHDARVPMADEFPRDSKLPRVIVSLKSVAPRGQGTQSRFTPGGRTDIHDGGISAAQNGGEIDDSPPQALAEPRRALMTPVIHPL